MTLPNGWEMVVGLEVHTELRTTTKMFCGCANAFGAAPNTHVCPVCLGLPGSLPVLNVRAVDLAMAIGLALHSRIGFSTFHRKNYFYPDMPKDFQISQYDLPINSGGYLDLPDGTQVTIERAHLEEDTGKTTHLGVSGRIHGADRSLVDYNRSGVPLVEIVSGPDIRSSTQARLYASELRGILIATGASDGRMEEGSMRIDANVSVRKSGEPFGTRCEIKNLNSLRSLVRAIDFEALRQTELSRRVALCAKRLATGTTRSAPPRPCERRKRPRTIATSASRTSWTWILTWRGRSASARLSGRCRQSADGRCSSACANPVRHSSTPSKSSSILISTICRRRSRRGNRRHPRDRSRGQRDRR